MLIILKRFGLRRPNVNNFKEIWPPQAECGHLGPSPFLKFTIIINCHISIKRIVAMDSVLNLVFSAIYCKYIYIII